MRIVFQQLNNAKSDGLFELVSQKFKSWARKRPAISECRLRLKKVVIDEIKNTR